MNKTKTIEQLRALVSRYDANGDYYRMPSRNYNEHSCRDEFINPLLRILGWDVENRKGLTPQLREVIAENYSNENERPDYTLNLAGSSKFFVEAKKPSVNIANSPDPALQARKYGWNAGHTITVLTNFEHLAIYDCSVMPKQEDSSRVARFRLYHYSEYVDRFDEIYFLLSRDSVYSGKFDEYYSDKILSSGSEKESIDDVFLSQINDWRLQIAASLIANCEEYRDADRLNDAVQTLINQIVFLRICEDRKLPSYHHLCEIIGDPDELSGELLELLRRSDKAYNSGLFASSSAIHYVDAAILSEIIASLYYPQSPYLFDIIYPGIFGQIYELFLVEQLIVEGDTVRLGKKGVYEDRSVVTTPIELVQYIVSRALQPILYGKAPEDIRNLRIADICCGSGIFLLEAYQVVLDACIDWYFENDPSHLIELGNGAYKLPFDEKKSLLCDCIFGVDIDIHAVEVAKFSLLIKLIEEENGSTVSGVSPILPALEKNIQLGNSLISENDALDAGIPSHEHSRVIPYNWSRINEGKKFDAIVGNPPYVQTKDIKALSTASEFKFYKEGYFTSYKQFDKYFLFIEKSMSLLVSGGFACFIVPNKFFKIASGKKLREFIVSQECLVSLDDFGDAQLFEGKTIYSSILCLRNQRNEQFVYASVSCPKDLVEDPKENQVIISSADIDEKPWKLTTDIDYLMRYRKMEELSVPITRHVELFNGIQTSAERNRTYWFLHSEIIEESERYIVFSRDGNDWRIEREILRPFFKPTESHGFNSYSGLKCDKWLIYPYDKAGHLIPLREMLSTYPNTMRYLESRKEELWPKQLDGSGTRDVPSSTEETWYQYGRTQALAAFGDEEKIIVGILSSEPLYYIDRNHWVIASGGTAGYCGIRMLPESPYSIEYMQAWLSNDNTERIFEIIGSDFEGGFKSRGTSLIETLPFIELDLNDESQNALHDEVTDLSKRIQEINGLLSLSPAEARRIVLEREKERLIARVSGLIDSVYGLEFVDEAEKQ